MYHDLRNIKLLVSKISGLIDISNFDNYSICFCTGLNENKITYNINPAQKLTLQDLLNQKY